MALKGEAKLSSYDEDGRLGSCVLGLVRKGSRFELWFSFLVVEPLYVINVTVLENNSQPRLYYFSCKSAPTVPTDDSALGLLKKLVLWSIANSTKVSGNFLYLSGMYYVAWCGFFGE